MRLTDGTSLKVGLYEMSLFTKIGPFLMKNFWGCAGKIIETQNLYFNHVNLNVNHPHYVYIKKKLSRYRPEQAHGRSGRLRPRIFLTFCTRRW
jgi:hypothetical protein